MVIEKRETILYFDNVSKIYQTRKSLLGRQTNDVVALNHMSFEIFKGEILGLVGESGSGKTTAGRLIVKLEEPQHGRILFNGKDITKLKGASLKDFRKQVQMIFQDPYQSLNPQMSVDDAIGEPVMIHRIGNEAIRKEMVWSAMQSARLSPPEQFTHRYPHHLSGGQRQRVAIARAMILNPSFVVADEPTSMLDAVISAQIFNILLDMREKLGVTLLFITHSLAAARYLCDRIAVIYKGKLMEIGPAARIIQHPKHPYTQALLNAIPRFAAHGDVHQYGTLLKAKRNEPESAGCPFFARCKKANESKCHQEMPLLIECEPFHSVACFYA